MPPPKIDITPVAFPSHDHITLRGEFYAPSIETAQEQPRYPGLIMTPGFSALKDHGLPNYARAFAQAGIATLIYDHRGFGNSDGQPRQHSDPLTQIKDYQAALEYMIGRADIHAQQIGLWGSSYSGGHVLILGAIEPRIQYIIAQTPFVSGEQATLKKIPHHRHHALEKTLHRLCQQQATLPVLPENSSSGISLFADDTQAARYFNLCTHWANQITPQSLVHAMHYEPHVYAPYIKTPTLMIIADHDRVTWTDLQEQAFERIQAPKEKIRIQGGHFSPFFEQQALVISGVVDFLLKNPSFQLLSR